MSVPSYLDQNAPTEISIPHGAEWRFEVPYKTIMTLTVKDGVGEIFGTELPNDVALRLTGRKGAVYAPLSSGCRLQFETHPNRDNINTSNEDELVHQYVSTDTVVPQLANLSFALEVVRLQAAADRLRQKTGPKVLIVGNSLAGKTAAAKTLVSYAAKMERVPVLVNLDPKEGVFSLPGLLTATAVRDFLDVESVNGWGGSPTTGATPHIPKQPLVRSYGFVGVSENVELYKYQLEQLGRATLARLKDDDDARVGGLVVDTPPLTMKDIDVIETIVLSFSIDLIVVAGNDRLVVDLGRKFELQISQNALAVVKISRCNAVTEIEESFVRKCQEDTIREYFNGNFRTRLSPLKFDVDMKTYVIYKVARLLDYTSQMAFLPSGDSYTADVEGEEAPQKEESLEKYFVKLDDPNSSNLENSIIVITLVPVPANGVVLPLELLDSSVLGYAHVLKVDDAKQKMSMLFPSSNNIPRHVLIATDIGYME
ncbi:hypothetical protein PUMCH_003903 [Australozyma saopauloensis]|uniref:Polynucleotide 5'-hydroxyl-kinase GRC3 n=1 Tax=Australozyma saopauloensis TaxID=291208 RepID=A0AAX4HDC5_9ASCO|nr:hypothetical protein PUMCH_003903 [[Candida] saopauloensis]